MSLYKGFNSEGGELQLADDKGNLITYPYNIKNIPLPFDTTKSFHVNSLKNVFRDIARPNLFKVEIIPPKSLMTADWDASKTALMALAKSATLPQVSIKEWVYERAGQKLHIPTNEVDYGELNITFYNDVDSNVRTMFNKWQNLCVFNYTGNYGSIPTVAVEGRVRIWQFDGAFNQVYMAEFTNAWPQTVGSIDLSQESSDSLIEFTVDFKFTMQKIHKNYDRIDN
jgi:hypothetical protein